MAGLILARRQGREARLAGGPCVAATPFMRIGAEDADDVSAGQLGGVAEADHHGAGVGGEKGGWSVSVSA